MIKRLNLKTILKIVPLLILMGCSGFRDSRLGKFHNNMTARYNGYFNAKELVLASQQQVEEAHIEDFSRVLDIYRWGNEVTGKAQASNMDKAIEKCSDVIQNHEGSQWIDDAYFTVAKAYFYKGDYYAALDLFKWLATEYKDKDIEPDARIWIVKTYIQMQKLDDAQAYMSNIQNEKKKFENFETDIQLVNAHLKIKSNNTTEAVRSLEKALPELKNRKEKNRCRFILAQLYDDVGYTQKSNELYTALLRKNMPYEFQFQTRIRVAKSTNLKNKANAEKVVKSFKKLLRDDNNREYFDQIHYEIANVYLESGSKQKAIEHYKISAWVSEDNFTQKANTFLALGDLFFNDDVFVTAGLYYDSCANVVPQNHPKYDEIKKQQVILGDLIKNLETLKIQDSLQLLAGLEPKEIEKRIDQRIEQEQKAVERAAEKEELKKQREELKKNLTESSIANAPNMRNNSGQWYFYNPVAIGKGASEFRVKWGSRLNEDNWRRSQKQYVFVGEDEDTTNVGLDKDSTLANKPDDGLSDELISTFENLDETKKEYFANIPFLPAQKRASDNLMIEALYNNGLIYYEKLNDLESAIGSFNMLISRFPENKFEAAAHFYLYKIFSDKNEQAKSNEQKEIILKDFATSQYATLILGGGDFEEVRNNPMLERYYSMAYTYYQNGQCDSVKSTYSQATKHVEENYLRDKFEFLSTLCKGKNLSVDDFIASLTTFSTTYSASETSIEARNLIRYLNSTKPKPKTADSTQNDSTQKATIIKKEYPFSTDKKGAFYFIIIAKDLKLNAQKVKSEIANYNVKYHRSEALSVKSLEFDNGESLFWVKTFQNFTKAEKYYNGLTTDEIFIEKSGINSGSMVYISTDNFKLLISEQNTSEYLEFFDLYFVKKEN